MGGSHRHIIQGFAADSVVFAHKFRIAGAMVAFRPVLFQRLFHRFPAGTPEITGFFIAQVNIPARLIKLVEGIPQDPAGRAALHKTVSAGVHCDDGAVIRRSEIIGPGSRCIGIGNHIFPGFLVKISVLHPLILLCFFSCLSLAFHDLRPVFHLIIANVFTQG